MNVALIWLALSATPVTEQGPVRPNSFFCDIINGYIAEFGEAAAEKWAREHKWSEKKIAEAKRCLLPKAT